MKFVVLGILLAFLSSSSYAVKDDKEKTKLDPLLEKQFHPTRSYPNLRYDPEFFIELPATSENWIGFIQDPTVQSPTTRSRLNLVSRYALDHHSWFGMELEFSADATAFAAFDNQEFLYRLGFRWHNDFSFGRLTWSIDPAIEHQWPNGRWDQAASQAIVLEAWSVMQDIFQFDSGVTVHCVGIQLHLNADYSVSPTTEYCTTLTGDGTDTYGNIYDADGVLVGSAVAFSNSRWRVVLDPNLVGFAGGEIFVSYGGAQINPGSSWSLLGLEPCESNLTWYSDRLPNDSQHIVHFEPIPPESGLTGLMVLDPTGQIISEAITQSRLRTGASCENRNSSFSGTSFREFSTVSDDARLRLPLTDPQ